MKLPIMKKLHLIALLIASVVFSSCQKDEEEEVKEEEPTTYKITLVNTLYGDTYTYKYSTNGVIYEAYLINEESKSIFMGTLSAYGNSITKEVKKEYLPEGKFRIVYTLSSSSDYTREYPKFIADAMGTPKYFYATLGEEKRIEIGQEPYLRSISYSIVTAVFPPVSNYTEPWK